MKLRKRKKKKLIDEKRYGERERMALMSITREQKNLATIHTQTKTQKMASVCIFFFCCSSFSSFFSFFCI
jgi:hypothetical protein